MKMPAAMRNKWVAALRSGKYTQDYGLLRTDKGHCCLGVLQEEVSGDVEKQANGSGRPAGQPTEEWYEANNINVNLTSISDNTKIVTDKTVSTLIEMNDGEEDYSVETETSTFLGNKSFNEIADWIEKNVETY